MAILKKWLTLASNEGGTENNVLIIYFVDAGEDVIIDTVSYDDVSRSFIIESRAISSGSELQQTTPYLINSKKELYNDATVRVIEFEIFVDDDTITATVANPIKFASMIDGILTTSDPPVTIPRTPPPRQSLALSDIH